MHADAVEGGEVEVCLNEYSHSTPSYKRRRPRSRFGAGKTSIVWFVSMPWRLPPDGGPPIDLMATSS
jgi:hypothetical protein